MATTNFVPGTVVASSWLNQVDEFVFGIDSYSGVDPTGVADSAAAINAGIISAAGAGYKKITFNGTYKANSQINLVSNMEYEFHPGSSIVINSTDFGLFIPNAATNITIRGLKMTGSCSRCIGTNAGVSITNLVITECDLSASLVEGAGYQAAISLNGASRVWITKNYLHGNGRGVTSLSGGDNADIFIGSAVANDIFIDSNVCTSTAVFFNIINTGASRVYITNNTIYGASATDGVANKGYAYVAYKGGAANLTKQIVSGNTFKDTVGMGVYLNETDDSVISDNTFENHCTNFDDTSVPAGAISLNVCTGTTITGNRIKTGKFAGICLATTIRTVVSDNVIEDVDGKGIWIRGVEQQLIVSDNPIKGCKTNIYCANTLNGAILSNNILSSAPAGFFGMQLGGPANRCVVQGNIVFSNARYGIIINDGSYNNISNNVCYDNGTETVNTYPGILNASLNSKISGNICFNTASTGQQYGIINTGNYCSITDNTLTRNQTDGISVSGTNIERGGNRLSTSSTPGITQGTATLIAGTVTVTTNEVRTGDIIQLTCITTGGTQGIVSVSTITNATSFVLTSSQGADTSTYAWKIIH